MKKLIMALELLLLSINVNAHVSPLQFHYIEEARQVGRIYNIPVLTAAVIGQESSYCTNKRGIDPTGYGCGQLHIKTISDTTGIRVPAKVLRTDNVLNIYLVAQVLHSCLNKVHGDFARALVCYNHGPAVALNITEKKARHYKYVRKVIQRMLEIRQAENYYRSTCKCQNHMI
jgi:hypothetical protein